MDFIIGFVGMRFTIDRNYKLFKPDIQNNQEDSLPHIGTSISDKEPTKAEQIENLTKAQKARLVLTMMATRKAIREKK